MKNMKRYFANHFAVGLEQNTLLFSHAFFLKAAEREVLDCQRFFFHVSHCCDFKLNGCP